MPEFSNRGQTKMDNLLTSFETLLNYATAEHNQDHADEFCDDSKKDCVTCEWLRDADKNYDKLRDLIGE